MVDDPYREDIFSAGTCGATISRNLLRSLGIKDLDTSEKLLNLSLELPLIRFGFESITQTQIVEDLQNWLGGADPQLEYQHAKLALRVLAHLDREPEVSLSELIMKRAYAARDPIQASKIAEELLQKSSALPLKVVVSCHDILGRVKSDQNQFESAAKHFLAGAESAHKAQLDYEEWDQRTNLIWCLYAQGRHLDVLRQIELAEPLARKIDRPHALTKTLIDRGNSEFALGRLDRAQAAYREVVTVAEAAGDIARQSDALGNLGSIAFKNGDYTAAEELQRKSLSLSRQLSDPSSAQFDLNNLALVLWKLGRSEEAIEPITEALEIAQQLGDLQNVEQYRSFLDHINSTLGRRTPPIETLKANQSEPVRTSAHAEDKPRKDRGVELEKRVRQLLNEGDRAGAMKLVKESLAVNPHDARLLCLHGVLLATEGDAEGARREYELALSYQPSDLEAHSRLVDVNTHTNQLEVLLGRYHKLVSDDPFNAGIRVGLALIYSRIGRHEDAIQAGLESVRLAPEEELAYMALAEAQRERAFYLLDNDWDAAWMGFQDFASTSDKLINVSNDQKGQWYALAATVFERFGMRSHFANPPLSGGMDTREITVLAMAGHYCVKANEHEPWRNLDALGQRISSEICALARPEQISMAAGNLRVDGHLAEALTLLILSLQMDPDQAEAKFQLAHIMNNGTEEGRKSALAYIGEAIRIDPHNAKYREAKLHFQNERFPVSSNTKETDNESG